MQPYIFTVCLFLVGYVGLAISLWPYIAPPTLTLWDAAAAPKSQAFMMIGTLFLLPAGGRAQQEARHDGARRSGGAAKRCGSCSTRRRFRSSGGILNASTRAAWTASMRATVVAGSSSFTSPRLTMSARIVPVSVLAIEPVSKTELADNGRAPSPASPARCLLQ